MYFPTIFLTGATDPLELMPAPGAARRAVVDGVVAHHRPDRPAGAMTHITQGLDDTVHQRTRLGILAVLAEEHRVQFKFLRETLGLSDGNLSGHLATLEGAGYLVVEKGYDGRRPRTWVEITRDGKAALTREIEALRALVSRFDEHTRRGEDRDPRQE